MDTFENTPFQDDTEPIMTPEENPAPQQQAHPQPVYTSAAYQGAGTGRKESPFADSPYVRQYSPQGSYQQPRQEFHYIPNTQPEQSPKTRTKKKKTSFWKTALAAVLIVSLVAAGCGITAWSVNRQWESRNAQTEQTLEQLNAELAELQAKLEGTRDFSAGSGINQSPITNADGSQLTPGQLYAQCVDSVVAISCTVQSSAFGQITEGSSSGSGFILTEDGYVVTNHHVISGATSVHVVTNSGEEYAAEIVGSDETNDVAILKVNASGLPAVSVGSSNGLYIGDMVVAIGNPLGELTATQTVGYVSGKGREVTTDNTIISMIQTDAAINPGNSGGPLFNMYGQVVGITTAKYSGTTSSGATIEGIGFAIPIDDVKGIISDLMEYGYVTGAYMGVMVRNTDAYAAMYGLPNGAYIESVEAGGAADKAGMKAKDIIIAIDDYKVESMTGLSLALRNYKAGDSAVVTLVRSGMEMTVTIVFDEKPNAASQSATLPEADSSMPNEGSYDEWYDYFFPFP